MEKFIKKIIKGLNLNKGASKKQLDILQNILNLSLPSDYLEFLMFTDGADGLIANQNYISIWKVEEIRLLNDEYAVDEFAPGILIIASDGGNTAYAFDTRTKQMPIVSVPFTGMSIDEVKLCSLTFNEFLKSYCLTKE